MSDLRFDKITDQLDKQVICVGQVRLLGTSAAEKVERVDGVGAAELFADGFPLIAARCKVQIVNQQKRFAGTAFCIAAICSRENSLPGSDRGRWQKIEYIYLKVPVKLRRRRTASGRS